MIKSLHKKQFFLTTQSTLILFSLKTKNTVTKKGIECFYNLGEENF